MIQTKIKYFVQKNNSRVLWLSIFLIYFFISCIHMGPSFSHLNSTVLGPPGDHTAGIMYDTWSHPNNPIPGINPMTNYPSGDNFRNPTSLTSIVLTGTHWTLSHLGTIATGWNLMVLIGYMSSALAMFGLIFWLTKNAWAAFFSGYAIAFTPYHFFGSTGQIAGLFGGIFILIIWQFLRLLRTPTATSALILGILLGISFYMDGYFILLGLLLLGIFWLSLLNFGLVRNRNRFSILRPQIINLVYSSVTALLFLVPLFLVRLTYADRIKSTLGNARGDLELNAMTYSAKLPMFVNAKGILYIGLSVLVLALIGININVTKKRNHIQSNRTPVEVSDLTYWTIILITFVGLWVSLQPIFHIGSVAFYNPSKLIILATDTWRVFGRLYTLVSIGFVILAGLSLHTLQSKFPTKKNLLFGVFFIVLIFEMSLYPLSYTRKTFSYTNDVPQVYTDIKNNPAIRAYAEYPLGNQEFNAKYFTYQAVSKKPIYNSFISDSPSKPLSQSITGILDPQTLPVLRSLGIDMINIRSIKQLGNFLDISNEALKSKELKKISGFTDGKMSGNSLLIKPGPVAEYALVMPGELYSKILLTKDGSTDYIFSNDFQFSLYSLPTAKPFTNNASITFAITSDTKRNASLIQNGAVIWSGTLTQSKQLVRAPVTSPGIMTLYIEKNASQINVTVSEPQVIIVR